MPGKRYDGQFKLSAARLVLEELIPVKRLTDQLDVPWYTEFQEGGRGAPAKIDRVKGEFNRP